jgi:hypothetical protein
VTRTWWPVLVVGLALAGCQVDRASADPVTVGLDQDFALGGGQEAAVDGGGLLVRFADVLEDSRCPSRVECFWTGQARVTVVTQPDGQAPSTAMFNTNPAVGQNISTVAAGGYTVTMRSLEPYPQTPDDATSLEDYRLILSVVKR